MDRPSTTGSSHARSVDGPILAELGGEAKAETTLTEVYSLMEAQKNGENGPLLTNGYANIFYVRDVNGALRAVVRSGLRRLGRGCLCRDGPVRVVRCRPGLLSRFSFALGRFALLTLGHFVPLALASSSEETGAFFIL